jgi:hypothetical protein
MSDPKEVFPILDAGSGVGASPSQAVDATTAAAALLGLVGFAFKDSTGKVVLPQLTALGQINVLTEIGQGANKMAKGELAAGSAGSIVDVTGASITLSLAKKYKELGFVVSCRTDALFQIVHVNDSAGTPVETVMCEAQVGPGAFSFNGVLKSFLLDTTADTGIPLLKVKAKNFEVPSSLRATICVFETT